MEFNMDEYLNLFLAEAEEQLETLNRDLLQLEGTPGEENPEIINEMFRAAHSLKGASATLGLMPISRLTHKIEDLMDGVRNQKIRVRTDVVDLLFQALDHLRVLVDQHQVTTDLDPQTEGIIGLLDKCLANETLTPPPPGLNRPSTLDSQGLAKAKALFDQGMNLYHLQIGFMEEAPMKAVTSFLILNNLSDRGEVIQSLPAGEELQAEDHYQRLDVWIASQHPLEVLEKACDVAYISGISGELLDLSETGAEEGPPAPGAVLPEAPSPGPPGEAKGAAEKEKGGKPAEGAGKKAPETIRVDIHRLDTLMNLIGELLISQTKFVQFAKDHTEQYDNTHLGESMSEEARLLGRIISSMQDGLMKVRMLPVASVFSRFPRVIRDLAHKSAKEVKLVVSGEETEVDKTVIEQIGDPLIHLIRNAVDHGIEPPAEREKAGKPRVGTVSLRAAHEGNQIIIQVEDDGAGIQPQKILDKAIEKKLISREEGERMGDKEIFNLLFLPGFSTAEKVTDVSGRGVGMDVVKRNITGLGGSIEVRSKPGAGSQFTIRLPLTLAIIQALLVRVGQEVYAIPLSNVIESFRVRPNEIRTIRGNMVFMVRGSAVPIRSLKRYFQLPEKREKRKYIAVVLVGDAERRMGFQVDELLGQQEVVIKPINYPWLDTSRFSGATILGNGKVVLILNVSEILESNEFSSFSLLRE